MTNEDEIDVLAGEYVLGTLDTGEREAVAERIEHDTQLAQAVAAWEKRLSPLLLSLPPVTPPPEILPRLKTKIAIESRLRDVDARVSSLARSRRNWRMGATAMAALALALAIFVGVREMTWATKPTTFVAVLQKDAMSPAFFLSVDTKTRVLTVRPVEAKGEPGKSFELWLVHNSLGAPRSLGLLSDTTPMTTAVLQNLGKSVYMDATYAVSVEPEGGSKTGAPTGPVVFAGKLLPGAL